MYALFILRLTPPRRRYALLLCQSDVLHQRDGSLGAPQYQYYTGKVHKQQRQFTFLVSHYIQCTSEYIHSMFQKEVVAFFVFDCIKRNLLSAVS